jgi:hypothetical protein
VLVDFILSADGNDRMKVEIAGSIRVRKGGIVVDSWPPPRVA